MQASSGKKFATLCVLWAASCAAIALNLGSVQGSPWLGRPLDIRIPAQFSAQDDPQASCITAEVLYGDTLLDAGKVFTRNVPVGLVGNARHVVCVKTSVAVDEPVVSIQLRVGCKEAATKQYVLLAETPPTMTAKTAPKIRVQQLSNRTDTRTRPTASARLTRAP